jgi:hypothetical protein
MAHSKQVEVTVMPVVTVTVSFKLLKVKHWHRLGVSEWYRRGLRF